MIDYMNEYLCYMSCMATAKNKYHKNNIKLLLIEYIFYTIKKYLNKLFTCTIIITVIGSV